MKASFFSFTISQETYEAALRDGEVFVGYARQLGARYVRTNTGRIGSAEATDEQWERTVRGLQTICDLGAPFGIEFPLETHQVIHNPACLTDTSTSTLRLLELVRRATATRTSPRASLAWGRPFASTGWSRATGSPSSVPTSPRCSKPTSASPRRRRPGPDQHSPGAPSDYVLRERELAGREKRIK